MKQLAIVIPAYKSNYLSSALDSIAAQTCQDFMLYIGDDSSPYDIESIVEQYKDKINLVYHRFDTNLGEENLVAQWERCIAMNQGEQWLWLFSDDDIMEPNCVASFYETLKEDNATHDLYHFNVKIINGNGCIIRSTEPYPQRLNSFSFYKGKMIGKIASLVVENIFSREVYDRNNGFKNFDLAWGSDTATWCIFSKERGFCTIEGAFVLWRNSGKNITPNKTTPIAERKMESLCDYYDWSFHFYNDYCLQCLYINCRSFVNRMSSYASHLSKDKYKEIVRKFCNIHHLYGFELIFRLLIRFKQK